MSINQEIQRINQAKVDIKEAIENKGVEVGDGTISTYAEKIDEISGGGSEPLNAQLAQYESIGSLVGSNNFVEIVSGDTYSVDNITENEYSKLAGTTKYIDQWGMGYPETPWNRTCWVSDTEFLSFFCAYHEDEMGGMGTPTATDTMYVKLMEVSNTGVVVEKQDLGTILVVGTQLGTPVYLGHGKLAILHPNAYDESSSFSGIVNIYDVDFENSQVVFNSKATLVETGVNGISAHCASDETLYVGLTKSDNTGIIREITTDNAGNLVNQRHEIGTESVFYKISGIAKSKTGHLIVALQYHTDSDLPYQHKIKNVDLNSWTVTNSLDMTYEYFGSSTSLIYIMHIDDTEILSVNNYYPGSGKPSRNLFKLVFDNGSLSLSRIGFDTLIFNGNYTNFVQISDKLASEPIDNGNNGSTIKLFTLSGNAIVPAGEIVVKAVPTSVLGMETTPRVASTDSLKGRDLTRSGATVLPLEYMAGWAGTVGNPAGAYYYAVVKLVPGENKVKLAETKIDGLSKTDCSAESAGDVYILG